MAITFACASSNGAQTSTHMNQLTAREQQDGWKLLFDGKTTNGWRNYRKQTIGPGWTVVDGILTRSGENAGDIITVDQYRNFDFMLDWKVAAEGDGADPPVLRLPREASPLSRLHHNAQYQYLPE